MNEGFLSPGSHNACSRFLLCCFRCCFWCLEHFIKFINRNAYIMVSGASGVGPSCLLRPCPIVCLSTDSNIWKELLHLFQRRLLPLDEERYPVRTCTCVRFFMVVSLPPPLHRSGVSVRDGTFSHVFVESPSWTR